MEELDSAAGGKLLLLTSLITTLVLHCSTLHSAHYNTLITLHSTHYMTYYIKLITSLILALFYTLCSAAKEIASADFFVRNRE